MHLDDLAEQAATIRARGAETEHEIRVCMAASCQSSGSGQVLDALRAGVEPQTQSCRVKGVGCMGLCSAGPLVAVAAPGDTLNASRLYRDVAPTDAPAILDNLGNPEPIERLHCPTDQPFFTAQHRIVLEHSGRIDPDSLDDAIAVGGYSALVRALTELTPAEVLREVTSSGLRGRGGGGYPTGLKWSTVAKMPGGQKYVVCNADEGDPGAFMDRAVLESDPHRVIEGMAIAGYAVGASKGYVYVRAEYPLAVERLTNAIRKAKRAGFLGSQIADTQFGFEIELRLGAGAFVCGEETALMASIQGLRGQPRPRPPYPAEAGLWGCPTLINNVETFANIAPIVREGGDWFAALGTEGSKGTKVFALAGTIVNTGLIEVPMGTRLAHIIEIIGGGIPGGGRVKAVQTGGPSGGCIPRAHLDTPVDYDSLKGLGTIMGSGGMIVMDERSSMVDVARYFMEFCMTESCGKCVPCRTGTQQMHALLERIAAAEAGRAELALLEELCEVVQATSLCGLGQTAPNPVLSTLRYFRDEYESRLVD
ncbi:NADH-ubiquinone oxidoreductase-F iron-sulfur binding region domain-containing protein [Marichromatium sp. AB31]|uniref:(2Fe-2S) ferredoxin domain-containing protein n=1 Tax=Marichromatium sp. AB31 TaxID=2483362 RepID=UPI000F3E5586|nr:NADH-ubiquinone oxidoreductase-F iron-sulfur binding region domain-containing protein [Marichromatium sp. AB31]RNE90235.1 NADH-quinone oxidoreductase subunit L [Marichromatium sp. AB31]